MNLQLWALCLLLAGCSLSLTHAETEHPQQLPAIVVVEEKVESAAQDNATDSNEAMPVALEPVPIVPAEDVSGTPMKPVFRVSKLNADKVVAFITRAGQIFEIQDEQGIGMIEGRQANQITNTTDNYVCNMGSVLIYSDEPCDEIAVLDSDTVKKEEEASAANGAVQTQREQSNQQKRRKNAAQRRKQQQLAQKRRKANQNKRRPNGQRRPQQQLTQQQKRKRLQAKRRRQQQQQLLEEEIAENVQTIKVKRPRPQSLQKRRRQQQIRKRRRQQQQKRRRQQQKKRKQQQLQQQQQQNVVMAGVSAVAGGGNGPQIQVLPQQSPGSGQRIRLLVRRGNGVRLDQNPDYPRWQWADEYDN